MKNIKLIITFSLLLSIPFFNTYSQDITTGLVSHWPLDGTGVDVGPGGNHGSIIGPVPTTDRFGNPNSAYLFNGDWNYIDCGNDVSPLMAQVFRGWG